MGHSPKIFTVDVSLVLAKDEHGGSCLLEALEQVDDLGLLLDVLHLLDDVEVGSARAPNVDDDRTDERRLCKALDLVGHRGREEERLTLPGEEVHRVAYLLFKVRLANQPVGLVEAEVFAQRERDTLLGEHIVESAGGGDAHVDSCETN